MYCPNCLGPEKQENERGLQHVIGRVYVTENNYLIFCGHRSKEHLVHVECVVLTTQENIFTEI